MSAIVFFFVLFPTHVYRSLQFFSLLPPLHLIQRCTQRSCYPLLPRPAFPRRYFEIKIAIVEQKSQIRAQRAFEYFQYGRSKGKHVGRESRTIFGRRTSKPRLHKSPRRSHSHPSSTRRSSRPLKLAFPKEMYHCGNTINCHVRRLRGTVLRTVEFDATSETVPQDRSGNHLFREYRSLFKWHLLNPLEELSSFSRSGKRGVLLLSSLA
jgi:hypothetical protein